MIGRIETEVERNGKIEYENPLLSVFARPLCPELRTRRRARIGGWRTACDPGAKLYARNAVASLFATSHSLLDIVQPGRAGIERAPHARDDAYHLHPPPGRLGIGGSLSPATEYPEVDTTGAPCALQSNQSAVQWASHSVDPFCSSAVIRASISAVSTARRCASRMPATAAPSSGDNSPAATCSATALKAVTMSLGAAIGGRCIRRPCWRTQRWNSPHVCISRTFSPSRWSGGWHCAHRQPLGASHSRHHRWPLQQVQKHPREGSVAGSAQLGGRPRAATCSPATSAARAASARPVLRAQVRQRRLWRNRFGCPLLGWR